MTFINVLVVFLLVTYLSISLVYWIFGFACSIDVIIYNTENKFNNLPHFCVLDKENNPKFSLSKSVIKSLFWVGDIIKFITF